MNFSDLVKDLFPTPKAKKPTTWPGRPPNVSHSGQVWRHPGVVISAHHAPHKKSARIDGKLVRNAVPVAHMKPKKMLGLAGRSYPVMLHRAVSKASFKARENIIKRAQRGRYVWQ